MDVDNRVVVVLNEKVDVGRLLNAAAHLALGFGASRTSEEKAALSLLEYADASGQSHPHISALSLVVLKANCSQLRVLRGRALDAGVPCLDFTSTMTEGTYSDQLERTSRSAADELVYYGVLLFGTRAELDPLTRKFSLFR
jgi:hypothetical protein